MPIGKQGELRRSIWTLDVGNSRAKLRTWRASANAGRSLELIPPGPNDSKGLRAGGAGLADVLDAVADVIDAAHSRGERPTLAYSCVAAVSLEAELVALLRRRLSDAELLAPDSGLENLCDPPQAVGRDRLYAARGAYELLRRSAIVIDAGSAVTVDALIVATPSGAPRAQFHGGAIAAGPALLAAALHQSTARLPEVQVRHAPPAVGTNTRAAIESGVFHGLRGAVRELVERACEQLGDPRLALAITGGAASLLLDPPLFGARLLVHEPDLVHLGLAHAALDVLGAPGGALRAP